MKRTTLITATLFALSFSSLTMASAVNAEEPKRSWLNFAADLQQKVDQKLNQQIEQAKSEQVIHQLFRYNTQVDQYVNNDTDKADQSRQADSNSAKLASK